MKKLIDKVVSFLLQPESLRYLIVGILTTVVGVGTYELARLAGIHYQAANVISWICAVTFAFFTNKYVVFRSKDSSAGVLVSEMIRFYGGRLATLALEMAVMWLIVDVLHIHDFIAKCVTQVIVFVSNYLISKFLIFTKKE